MAPMTLFVYAGTAQPQPSLESTLEFAKEYVYHSFAKKIPTISYYMQHIFQPVDSYLSISHKVLPGRSLNQRPPFIIILPSSRLIRILARIRVQSLFFPYALLLVNHACYKPLLTQLLRPPPPHLTSLLAS